MINKETGPLKKEAVAFGVRLDPETRESLKEILVQGEIYKTLHWGERELPKKPHLLQVSPQEAEILANNAFFTRKQNEVLKLRLGTKTRPAMSVSETAKALGLTHSAVSSRENLAFVRLKDYILAIRNPEMEIFFYHNSPHEDPCSVLIWPGRVTWTDIATRSNTLGKWQFRN